MRQLIQSYRTGEMKVEDVPPPSLRGGGVLVRTVRSLVSAGTEKMIVDIARKSLLGKARARPDLVRKTLNSARKQGVLNTLQKVRTKLDTPIPLGYSSAGVVVEVGENVSEYRVGDRVACAGAGYANHADYSYVPRNLLARVPHGLSMDEACGATVGAIALQAVRQVDPTLGERVAVLGLGLIGQITAQLLRANGCRVLGFDPNPSRVQLALELGAQAAVSENLEAAAESFTRGQGIDAVVVAASTPSAAPLEQAGLISRLRGRVVVVGFVGMEVPRSLYYRKELDVRMSMSYGPGRYDPDFEERGFDYPIAHVRWTEQRNLEAVLQLAAEGQLKLSPLVTHRFGIDDALDAYSLIGAGEEPYLGILLDYGADDEQVLLPRPSVRLQVGRSLGDRIGIGVVGAGAFGQSVLLPALRQAGGTENIAIASAGGMSARRIGELYGFHVATADADEILKHDDVDAVFVLTRHNLHASLAEAALRAGKSVFTEKPLALNAEDLDRVIAARENAPGDVMVGFNRRFAPLVAKIQEHFAGRSHPLVMSYRINAGFIPSDHWQHDPVEGGGRLLGEVCHFVDLLQYLAGSPPVRVFADSITGDSRYRGDDNVALTIHFADGSIGTVIYTSMGDSRMTKEHLEVFGEGKAAVLSDFRNLELVAEGRSKHHKSANQDKGFHQEITSFLDAIRNGSPIPIPFEESVATTRVCLEALESLQKGQERELPRIAAAPRTGSEIPRSRAPEETISLPRLRNAGALISNPSLQGLYERLPVGVQNAVVSAIGARSQRLRVGEPFSQACAELRNHESFDADRLRADQTERMRRMVRLAAKTVPYYRDLFRREGIDPESILEIEDLGRIPTLDKETVRTQGRRLRNEELPERKVLLSRTSGTTGTALEIYQTREAIAWKNAVTQRQRGWYGIESGERFAVFGGQSVVPFAQRRPPFWRSDRARARMLFSLYHMKPEFLADYAQELRKTGYSFWQGYPSSLALIADYLIESGIELGDAAPRAVFTSSETLHDFHRARIAEATSAPVGDLYANAEFSVSVSQNPEGRYLVDTEFCVVEIDPHEETDEWVRGEVLSTGLTNTAMPLLRYRTGDLALMRKAGHGAADGRPELEHIEGRIDDTLVTPDGRRIGRMDHVFKGALEIREAQIVQTDFDRLLVRLVPRSGFGEAEQKALEHEFRKRLGREIEIRYQRVDSIPREANGKFRAVINEMETSRHS